MGHMEKAPGAGGLGACAGDHACIGAREWASCSWVGLMFAPVLMNGRVKWWEAAPLQGGAASTTSFFHVNPGGVLLSHTLPSAVPSALWVLATGFGMGPGVSPTL